MRERRDLVRDLPPAERLPRAVGLAPQERVFAAPFGAVEEHRDQTRKMVEMRVVELHASSLPGGCCVCCFLLSYSAAALGSSVAQVPGVRGSAAPRQPAGVRSIALTFDPKSSGRIGLPNTADSFAILCPIALSSMIAP